MFAGPRFLEACRRRYGNAVTFGTLFDNQFVMLFDPSLVKQLFQGSNEQLHAGEANALLGPILGERSVLLLDGAEHLRHRRLMLPPFHGRRMQAYADVDARRRRPRRSSAWPVGEPFALLPSMQSLTLHVILRGGVRLRAGAGRGGAPAAAARDGRADRAPARAAADRRARSLRTLDAMQPSGSRQAAARSTRSCMPRSRAGARTRPRGARGRVLDAAARRGRARRGG